MDSEMMLSTQGGDFSVFGKKRRRCIGGARANVDFYAKSLPPICIPQTVEELQPIYLQKIIYKPSHSRSEIVRRQDRSRHCKQKNDAFCAKFRSQLLLGNIKSAQKVIGRKLSRVIESINSGMNSTHLPLTPAASIHTQIKLQNDKDDDIPIMPLLPKSKWIYETPDKQRIRKMDELNFTHSTGGLEPAVIQDSKRVKTIYTLKENIPQNIAINIEPGQMVPINLPFLQPVVIVPKNNILNKSLKEISNNQFLSSTEETIDLNNSSSENKRKRRREEDLTWYEQRMKTLATCRPVKVMDRMDRRQFLQRKSLSFQEDSVNTSSTLKPRFRSLEALNECSLIDDDEQMYDSTPTPTVEDSPGMNMLYNKFNKLVAAPIYMPIKDFD